MKGSHGLCSEFKASWTPDKPCLKQSNFTGMEPASLLAEVTGIKPGGIVVHTCIPSYVGSRLEVSLGHASETLSRNKILKGARMQVCIRVPLGSTPTMCVWGDVNYLIIKARHRSTLLN